MNELDKFFQTEVKAFDEEIKKIDTVLKEVIPTFSYRKTIICHEKDRCIGHGACTRRNFRYCFNDAIVACDEISGSVVQKWSTSINTMMLSLVTYLQKPEFSSLFVQGRRSLTLPKKVTEKIREKLDIESIYQELVSCFMTRHNHRDEPLDQGFHDSKSYGPNPWSSLAWFGEVMLFMEKKEAQPNRNLIELWCNIVEKKFIKELKKYPKMDHIGGINNMRAAICFNLFEKFQKNFFKDDEAFEKKLNHVKRNVYELFRPILLNRIYQQLTSFEISDGFFDPGELAFNMEGLVRLDKKHHYYQDNLLERFFKVMTECLHKEAFWRTTKPVGHINEQGHTLLPLSAEVANSLLRICQAVSEDEHGLNCFQKHKELFRQYAHWVMSQKVIVKAGTTFVEQLFQWSCDLWFKYLDLDGIGKSNAYRILKILLDLGILDEKEFEKGNVKKKEGVGRMVDISRLLEFRMFEFRSIEFLYFYLTKRTINELIEEIEKSFRSFEFIYQLNAIEVLIEQGIVVYEENKIGISKDKPDELKNMIIKTLLNLGLIKKGDNEYYKISSEIPNDKKENLKKISNQLFKIEISYEASDDSSEYQISLPTKISVSNAIAIQIAYSMVKDKEGIIKIKKEDGEDVKIQIKNNSIENDIISSLSDLAKEERNSHLCKLKELFLLLSIINYGNSDEKIEAIIDKIKEWKEKDHFELVKQLMSEVKNKCEIKDREFLKNRIRNSLYYLFPFFSTSLRKNLYPTFDFNNSEHIEFKAEKDLEKKLKKKIEETKPKEPILITLNIIRLMIEKQILKSSNSESDQPFQLDESTLNKIENKNLKKELEEFLGSKIGKKVIKWHGWHSEHTMQPLHNSRFIHLWATREYFIYLMQYRAMRCEDMARELIVRNDFKYESFKAPEYYIKNNQVVKWDQDNLPKYKDYWKENIIPGFQILRGERMSKIDVYKNVGEKFLEDNRNNPDKCAWSMLLYGPPGTGKSTIAEKLAQALRWPLITITPSDFIRQGDAMVEARAKQIFRSLRRMQDVVVLFDEIDRLLLDRDAPMYFDQHDTFQFMTPGMLVKLKDLWNARRVIFVIATNYEERIDFAAKRKGRIDHSYLVLPQDGLSRLLMLIKLTLMEHDFIKERCKDNSDEKERILNGIIALVSIAFKEERPDLSVENKLCHIISQCTNNCKKFPLKKCSQKNEDDNITLKNWKIFNQKTFGYTSGDMKNLAKKWADRVQNIESIFKYINYLSVKEIEEPEKRPKEVIGKVLEDIFSKQIEEKDIDFAQIRLKSYIHRFKDIDKENNGHFYSFQTRQQPFYEIFGLIAMMIEDGLITKNNYFKDKKKKVDAETIKRVLKNLKKCNDKNIIKNLVKEDRILNKIYKNEDKSKKSINYLVKNLSSF